MSLTLSLLQGGERQGPVSSFSIVMKQHWGYPWAGNKLKDRPGGKNGMSVNGATQICKGEKGTNINTRL